MPECFDSHSVYGQSILLQCCQLPETSIILFSFDHERREVILHITVPFIFQVNYLYLQNAERHYCHDILRIDYFKIVMNNLLEKYPFE